MMVSHVQQTAFLLIIFQINYNDSALKNIDQVYTIFVNTNFKMCIRDRSTGNITEEMIEQYVEHHREGPNSDQHFILE